MRHTGWAVDWNPDVEEDETIHRQVLRALKEDGVIQAIKRLADQAAAEAIEDGLETEHLVWLETESNYAFFVRIWYEASEEKVFIIIEENDLGDIGFFLLDDYDCATYGASHVLRVEFRDPETMGVPR